MSLKTWQEKEKCGCIIDTLNQCVEKFCPKHQAEFDAWKREQISTYCP